MSPRQASTIVAAALEPARQERRPRQWPVRDAPTPGVVVHSTVPRLSGFQPRVPIHPLLSWVLRPMSRLAALCAVALSTACATTGSLAPRPEPSDGIAWLA